MTTQTESNFERYHRMVLDGEIPAHMERALAHAQSSPHCPLGLTCGTTTPIRHTLRLKDILRPEYAEAEVKTA